MEEETSYSEDSTIAQKVLLETKGGKTPRKDHVSLLKRDLEARHRSEKFRSGIICVVGALHCRWIETVTRFIQ